MFTKIITITLISYLATLNGHANATKVIDAEKSDSIWDGFVTTWPTTISDGYFDLPLTEDAAESEGWTEIKGAAESSDIIALGYMGDPRFTLLFSRSTRDVMGYQIGIPAKDVEGLPMNYDNHVGLTKKFLNGEYYHTGTVYISKNENGVNEIWLQYNATWYDKVPTDGDLVISETPFLEKNCIATMANPHYYIVNSTTDCLTFYPWVLLRKDQSIVGVAFQAFGNLTSTSDRTWWESIPPAGVFVAISDAPQCVINYGNDYGIISIHTWFIKDPVNITCSDA